MKKLFILILFLLFLLPGFCLIAFLSGQGKAQAGASSNSSEAAQPNYIPGSYVMGSGGVLGAAGTNNFHMATAGEICVGGMQGANNFLFSGFWHPSGFGPTAVEQDVGVSLPTRFELHQNYPNPFNPQTTIRYDLPGEYLVTVEIFNVVGQRIRLLLNRQIQGPGSKQVVWDGRDDHGKMLGSGIYLYRITASYKGSGKDTAGLLFQEIKKMLLVK